MGYLWTDTYLGGFVLFLFALLFMELYKRTSKLEGEVGSSLLG